MTPDALWSLLRGAYTVRYIPRFYTHWAEGPAGMAAAVVALHTYEMTPWMWEMRFERELAQYWREMREKTDAE